MTMPNVSPRTDADLQQDVMRELRWDSHVDVTEIGVEVTRGIVTLSGTVNSWAKRVAAKEAAHRARGVHDVVNEIDVRLPHAVGRTDTEIAGAVRHALTWDVFVPQEAIATTVTHGWVTLEGQVDNWHQHDAAEAAIRNLEGVCGVTNLLAVAPSPVFPGDVRSAIEAALERRAVRETGSIDIDVCEGRVTLKGVVNNWKEKEAVLGAVKGTHGVRLIADQLRVVADAL